MDESSQALAPNDQSNYSYGSVPPPTETSGTSTNRNTHAHAKPPDELPLMTPISISAILSTAFSYGCIMTTLFLLTLPIECQRIESESSEYYSYTVRKSIALGGFAAIAGLAQLVSPLIGLLSDNYEPRGGLKRLGKRLPYLILGSILVVFGLGGMLYASSPIHQLAVTVTEDSSLQSSGYKISTKTLILGGSWIQYTIFYTIANIGLNTCYTVMLPMIPDYIPHSQTGAANGTLALMVVLGSLFGFGMFHGVLGQNVLSMYKLYGVVAATSGVVTYIFVCDRERVLAAGEEKGGDEEELEAILSDSDVKDEEQGGDEEELEAIHSDSDVKDEERGGDEEELEAIPSGSDMKDEEKGGDEEELEAIPSDSDMKDEEAEAPASKTNEEGNNELTEKTPALNELAFMLLYEPIMEKTQAEILSCYWIDILEHRDFFIVTISRFFYYMGVSSQTFFLYFIHDELNQSEGTSNPEAAVALLAIIGQTAGAITCYPIGIISDQWFGGRRKPFVYISCICLALGNLTLILCTELRQMMWVSILLGAANGMYLTMDTSLAVDTLDLGAVDKNGADDKTKGDASHTHEGAAQLLGVWGVFGFVGSATGPLIGGLVLLLVGRQDTNPGQFYSLEGYKYLFSLTAFYFLCSAVSLAFVRKKGV